MSENDGIEKNSFEHETKSSHYPSLTEQQIKDEIDDLHKVYPIVRLVNKKQIEEGSCLLFDGDHPVCGRKACAQLLNDGGEREWSFCLNHDGHRAMARYVEVDGEPSVLLCVAPVDSDWELIDRRLLYIDSLTGAYNRRFYEDELRKQHLYAGVAIIDLDDFKLVNDTMGHHTGDLALQLAAGVMLRCIRESDMLVRIGGDEFVLVMPNVGASVFQRRLQVISKNISQTTIPGYDELCFSVSIGGVISRGSTVEEALRQADGLMYRAKRHKNSVITDSDPLDAEEYSKPFLLIVDDSEINRTILSEMLKDEYEIIEADRGTRAIEILHQLGEDIAIVLLDIVMPEMSGFEVLSAMSHNGWLEDIPVIMISGEDSDDIVFRAYEQGASDYISRPFDMRMVRQRVSNTMRLYVRQRRLSALLSQQFYKREKSRDMLVNIMGGAMELRNGESGPHVLHVRNLTEMLLDCLMRKTDRYFVTGKQRTAISLASVMHDIGKLAIPDAILNKPGSLTEEEFEIMKTHTTLGAEMLTNLTMYSDDPLLLQTAHDICRWHHERYDGNGYPDGLVGDQIPISAQVVSLADVYDALTSERVYKEAVPHKTAMKMILSGECGEFNPLLIECLAETEDCILRELNTPNLTPPLLTPNQNKERNE